MSTLLDPLDEQQQTLLELVWPKIAETGRCPKYRWVAFMMRRQGYDAAQVLGGLPSVGTLDYRDRYSAVWTTSSGGGVYQPGNDVGLTVAGLYHIKYDAAKRIIGGVLSYARALSKAQEQIADHPFDLPDVQVSLKQILQGDNEVYIAAVAAVVEHEWPAMNVNRGADDWSGQLSLLASADFMTVEEYLTAITAACPPPRPPLSAAYLDPKTLPNAITNLGITTELVLGANLVVLPPANRTAWFSMDVGSGSDLQSAISAAGELLAGLDVPGRNPQHATGRLLGHLKGKLPKLTNTTRVEDAIKVLDAVRDIRNSDVHSKPAQKLLDAYDLLGLTFPVANPAEAWNMIRAQLADALTTLQDEIYAAR